MNSNYDREGRELAAGRRFRYAIVGSIAFHIILAIVLVTVVVRERTVIIPGGISISLGKPGQADGGGGGGAAPPPPPPEPPKPKPEKKAEPKPEKKPVPKPEPKKPEPKPKPKPKPEKKKEPKKESKPKEKAKPKEEKKPPKQPEKKPAQTGPDMDALALGSLDSMPPLKQPKVVEANATGTGQGGQDIGAPTGSGVSVGGGLPSVLSQWARMVQMDVETYYVPPAGIQLTEGNRRAEVMFIVDRHGNLLEPPRVIKQGSQPELGEAGVQAILHAAPLPPLPDNYDAVDQEVVYVFTLEE